MKRSEIPFVGIFSILSLVLYFHIEAWFTNHRQLFKRLFVIRAIEDSKWIVFWISTYSSLNTIKRMKASNYVSEFVILSNSVAF